MDNVTKFFILTIMIFVAVVLAFTLLQATGVPETVQIILAVIIMLLLIGIYKILKLPRSAISTNPGAKQSFIASLNRSKTVRVILAIAVVAALILYITSLPKDLSGNLPNTIGNFSVSSTSSGLPTNIDPLLKFEVASAGGKQYKNTNGETLSVLLIQYQNVGQAYQDYNTQKLNYSTIYFSTGLNSNNQGSGNIFLINSSSITGIGIINGSEEKIMLTASNGNAIAILVLNATNINSGANINFTESVARNVTRTQIYT